MVPSPHFLFAFLSICWLGLFSLATSGSAAVVINEILYRPGVGFPENTALEFVELRNTDTTDVDVGGWAFTSGISYVIPIGTTIPAGGHLVIASNPVAVQVAYGVTGVLGPWVAGGVLSNKDENIRLSKPGVTPGTFDKVDEVHYASEGDWATRVREPQFNGWAWSTPATSGRSLELRNPLLSNDNGQNWAPSVSGTLATPGALNSVNTTNVAPIIRDVKHSPAVPRPNQPVTIACELTDEATVPALSARLFWRDATSTTPGAFQSLPMIVGTNGKFTATLGGMPNATVVEFYVEAFDGVNTSTWPAPTSEGQNANALYQVSNQVFESNEFYHLLLLTGAENAAFNAVNRNSDRQFNITLVTVRGSSTSIRYRTSLRIRGNSSRSYTFPPMRVSMPFDDRLDGVSDFNLNPKASFLQFVGMRMFEAAGVRATTAIPVEMRRNGTEYTRSDGSTPDFGKWVRIEEEGSDFVNEHWPLADDGNLYKKVDAAGPENYYWRAGRTPPNNPDARFEGWTKQNNSGANDWSDLTNFLQVWQNAAAPHFPGSPVNDAAASNGTRQAGIGNWAGTAFSDSQLASVATVSDLDQWARFFAVSTIMQDLETKISNGVDDDYFVYFEPNALGQRRMHLVAHDTDTILGRGDNQQSATYTGLYDMTGEGQSGFGFRTLLPLIGNASTPGNAAFQAKYSNEIRRLYGSVFNADTSANPYPPFYAFLDNELSGWVPANTITAMKNFATARQNHLLGLLQAGPLIPPPATSVGTVESLHGAVMISEVLAHNVAAVANGALFPDVIELHNASSGSVDLSGFFLSDNLQQPAKYALPAGTVIPAGGYLQIYADSEPGAGLHTGFGLDQEGDQLVLSDPAGNALDSVTFGPQAADLSIARTGPGLNTWALTQPTLGNANGAPVALAGPEGLRINEIFSNPDYLSGTDFLEIYNNSMLPVAAGGLAITDDPINRANRHTLPPLSFVTPQGFMVLRPKGSAASINNPSELPFKFSSYSSVAAVLGTNGSPIDQISTIALPPDVSRGRLPDGGASLANFGLPGSVLTPGAANVPPPANVLALLNGLRISELLYRPNELEFIELQNISAATLDISGVRFTAGLTYTFPAGTTLAPGAFIVVVKDRAAFTARYGPAVPLAPGNFTGTLDNAGETVALQPPAPWNVNILNFAYSPNWYAETNSDRSLAVRDPAGTEARDWDQRETWRASLQAFGNPGAGLPPTITSPLVAGGGIDAAFSYQITASNFPTGYNATGLPAQLSLNPLTGLISGTPVQLGTFTVTIEATNAAGSDVQTLLLTIGEAGPVAGFAWSPVETTQLAGVPFPVTLRAIDSNGQTSTTFTGPVRVSAERTVGGATVVFTEFGTSSPTPDYFELQNVTGSAVSTEGWFVATSASSRGVNSAGAVTWSLPTSVPARGLLGVVDTSNAPGPNEVSYGADIDWSGNGPSGWAMLVDQVGVIRDFVAWGYSAAEIATINLTINGFPLTVGPQWSGNGAPVMNAGNSLSRSGTADGNSAADWSVGPTPNPRVVQNPGLVLPWAGSGTTLAATPNGEVTLVRGVWTGMFTVLDIASSAQLQASAVGQPAARSNVFATAAPAVNTAPVFTKGPDQTLNEDAGAQAISNWATNIYPGASSENTQLLTFIVSTDNSALFAASPSITPNGTLSFTPAPDAHGTATVSVRLRDSGGTAGGGDDSSAIQTFVITVLPVNDAPVIVAGGNIAVSQRGGPYSSRWATTLSPGPANEASQSFTISVTNNQPGLFLVPPALAVDGTLTFTPSPSGNGTAAVTITLTDDGGTANSGRNTTQRTLNISVRALNVPPVFDKGPDLVAPVLGTVTAPWASNISAGEPGQVVNFIVTTDRPDLFRIPPAISPTGVISFSPNRNAGVATVTVRLKDNGGTLAGGIDTSDPQTFQIQITSAASAAGTYRGLVHQPEGAGITHAQSGMVELKINPLGSMTGKVKIGGKTYAIKALVGDTGGVRYPRKGGELTLARTGLPNLKLKMRVDLTGPVREVTGEIFEGATLFAEFVGDRDAYSKRRKVPLTLRNSATDAGNYTAIFPVVPAPNGGLEESQYPQADGWCVLQLAGGGTITVRGQFADGSPFAQTSALNSDNEFPFYVPYGKGLNSVIGQMTMATSGPTPLGSRGLIWFKAPKSTAARYPAGWPDGIEVGFEGASRNLVSESKILPIGSAMLSLDRGGLAGDAAFSKELRVRSGNRLSVVTPGPDKLTLAIKPNGEWKGSFIHPVTRAKTNVQGVILRDRGAGRGFFLGANEAGEATLTPIP